MIQHLTFILALLLFLPIIRLIKGPTLFDRVLSIGTISTKTIILVIFLGFLFNRVDMFIDIAISYAILNFVGTIVVSKYFDKDHILEAGEND